MIPQYRTAHLVFLFKKKLVIRRIRGAQENGNVFSIMDQIKSYNGLWGLNEHGDLSFLFYFSEQTLIGNI